MSVSPLPLAGWSEGGTMALLRAWSALGWYRWSPLGAGTGLFQVLCHCRPRPEAVADAAREDGRYPGHSRPVWREPEFPGGNYMNPAYLPPGDLGATLQA